MDLVFVPPVDWDSLDARTRLRSFADADFCRIEHATGATHRFIRCLLPLPVPELGSEIRFGVWMSISGESWDIYAGGSKPEDMHGKTVSVT